MFANELHVQTWFLQVCAIQNDQIILNDNIG